MSTSGLHRYRPPWKNWAKDQLNRLGLQERSLETLWRYRHSIGSLTGAFTMHHIRLAGVHPGPRKVDVAVAKLRYEVTRFVWERYYEGGLVFTGNWDEVVKTARPALDDHPAPYETHSGAYAHRTVIELCHEGRPFRETSEYGHLAERITRGGRPRGCSTIADLDIHFEELCRDRASIAQGDFGRRRADGTLDPHSVSVFVDRYGHLIHRGQGMHQLRMAEFYGLTHVPVDIVALHVNWLRPALQRHRSAAEAVRASLRELSIDSSVYRAP